MHEDELTPSEAEALGALPREARPSDLLEERTVQALRACGWIRRRRALPSPLAWSAVAAACAVFFVAGFAIGQGRGTVRERNPSQVAPLPATTADTDAPIRDSTQVTLADPAEKHARSVQHVVWF